MKKTNKCAEMHAEGNKTFANINTKVNENKSLETILDAILNTLQDIKAILDKKRPLSSEDL